MARIAFCDLLQHELKDMFVLEYIFYCRLVLQLILQASFVFQYKLSIHPFDFPVFYIAGCGAICGNVIGRTPVYVNTGKNDSFTSRRHCKHTLVELNNAPRKKRTTFLVPNPTIHSGDVESSYLTGLQSLVSITVQANELAHIAIQLAVTQFQTTQMAGKKYSNTSVYRITGDGCYHSTCLVNRLVRTL